MKLKKPITQKHTLGCGIACLAFIMNSSYETVLKHFGVSKAKLVGIYCNEMVKYLRKKGFYVERHYLKNPRNKRTWRRKIYNNNTIVLIERNKRYPKGHYLVRYKNVWMDPWININTLAAKSGFRKKLPGKPMYGIFIINPKDYTIVFDLDGTIVNSIELHAESFVFAIKKLGYKNYRKLYEEYKKHVGLPMENITKLLIPNITRKEIERIRKLKDHYFQKNIKRVKIIRKTLEIIKKLKIEKFKLAIFTSSPRKITNLILSKLNLKRYFDYIVCKEDVKNPKPDKEGLIKIMKKFRTEKLIFIGDSKYDKLAAKNAKVKFIDIKKLNKKYLLYKLLD